jgi:hypothetical protein
MPPGDSDLRQVFERTGGALPVAQLLPFAADTMKAAAATLETSPA